MASCVCRAGFYEHWFILQNDICWRQKVIQIFKKKELFWLVSAIAVSQQNSPEEMYGDSIATRGDLCYILHAVAVFSWENPAIPHCPHSHGVCAVQPDCAWQVAAAALATASGVLLGSWEIPQVVFSSLLLVMARTAQSLQCCLKGRQTTRPLLW